MTGDRIINTGGGNYYESIDTSGGNYIQGNYINMSQDLTQAAVQIQDLIEQLQKQGMPVDVAQEQVAKGMATHVESNPTMKDKLVKWGQSLGDATVSDVVKGVVKLAIRSDCISLAAGQQFVTTFGFPQIAFCLTNPIRFPCTTQAYPESVQHILEARGIPPQPITSPIRPGKSGNQVPSVGYPLLFTIDRPRATSRRNASTSSYLPCAAGIQDLDEYPPSVLLENAGSAHIKCIGYSEQAFNQGFSWMPGSVTFFTFGKTCRATVEVCLLQSDEVFHLQPKTIRAIRIPFDLAGTVK